MSEKSKTIKRLRALFTLSSVTVLSALCIYLFVPERPLIDPITTATVNTAQSDGDEETGFEEATEPSPQDQKLLEALQHLDEGDVEAVIQARDAIGKDHLDYQLLTWLIATSGRSAVPTDELRLARERLDGWPNQNIIERNLEIAMARDPLAIMRLRLSLGDKAPQSFQAAYALAKSYLLTGNQERARALIIPFWHDKVLSGRDELRVLETFEKALTARDHEIRFFNMMSRNRVTAAGRIARQLEWDAIHSAWAAVIRRQKSAREKINGLSDKDKESAAYSFMKTEFLRRSDKDDEAIAVLNDIPNDPSFLINPNAWWDERRIISRHKFEAGDAQSAYDLVAAHQGGSDATQIDAAFHAGWYALRGLENPELAVNHFKTIIDLAKGDISKARGFYWLGRALGDTEEALQAFQSAAAFKTTYYGWLASEELGIKMTLDADRSQQSTVDSPYLGPLRAAERLLSIDQKTRARALYLAMGWSWEDPVALSRAAEHASDNHDHFAALKIAKAAHWRGINMGSLTHPLGALSNTSEIDTNDRALAYAIARQESEFNVSAVSRANAKGIMQLLPGTAKEMARKIDIDYDPSKLTTDASYNARLGVAYLNQQLDKFGGSYILTFAAYNAGPSRANEWIERFGDPRGRDLYEVIDWIEMIPFPETRSYVQRIIENFQVYKSKLGQETSITKDLRFGTTGSN